MPPSKPKTLPERRSQASHSNENCGPSIPFRTEANGVSRVGCESNREKCAVCVGNAAVSERPTAAEGRLRQDPPLHHLRMFAIPWKVRVWGWEMELGSVWEMESELALGWA